MCIRIATTIFQWSVMQQECGVRFVTRLPECRALVAAGVPAQFGPNGLVSDDGSDCIYLLPWNMSISALKFLFICILAMLAPFLT